MFAGQDHVAGSELHPPGTASLADIKAARAAYDRLESFQLDGHWTVPDRRITITGKRGDQPFEEVIS
jgi:hypothetical protein